MPQHPETSICFAKENYYCSEALRENGVSGCPVGVILNKIYPSIQNVLKLIQAPTVRDESAFADRHFILVWAENANLTESWISKLCIHSEAICQSDTAMWMSMLTRTSHSWNHDV